MSIVCLGLLGELAKSLLVEEMFMSVSTHKVEVVRVQKIHPHPNADSLGVVTVWGYTCCVRLADVKEGDLLAYIPPDSIVPDLPEYAFLQGHRRIRVKKLRGVISQGLLVPAPAGAVEGQDVAEQMGITHYDPPEPISSGGEAEAGPPGYRPFYDVESLRRCNGLLALGELIHVTEKVHGSSGKWCFADGRMWCSSHREWKKQDESNLWWKALARTPGLQKMLEEHPEITAYGEVYGSSVQNFKYGMKPGEIKIAVFDLLIGNVWQSFEFDDEMSKKYGFEMVPLIVHGEPFDMQKILEMAEGKSLVPGADHIREGCVVKPVIERTDISIGRVQLKVVGNGFLLRD
jgi:RNA ligase (TIGR02306 family)